MSEEFFPAMGTMFHAVLADGSSIDPVRDHVRRTEDRFSRFLRDSELSRINRSPRRTIRPSNEFADVLGLAAEARERTEGLVDAGAGAKAVLLRGEDGLAWAAGQLRIRAAMVTWHDRSVFATAMLELAA